MTPKTLLIVYAQVPSSYSLSAYSMTKLEAPISYLGETWGEDLSENPVDSALLTSPSTALATSVSDLSKHNCVAISLAISSSMFSEPVHSFHDLPINTNHPTFSTINAGAIETIVFAPVQSTGHKVKEATEALPYGQPTNYIRITSNRRSGSFPVGETLMLLSKSLFCHVSRL